MHAGIKLRSPLAVALPAHDGQRICFALEALSTSMIIRPVEEHTVRFVFRKKSGYHTSVLHLLKETLYSYHERFTEICGKFSHGIESEVFLPPFYPDLRSLVAACVSNYVVGINHLAGEAKLDESQLRQAASHSPGIDIISHHCEAYASFSGGIFFMQSAEEYAIYRIYTPPGLYIALFGFYSGQGNVIDDLSDDLEFHHDREYSRLSMEAIILGLMQSDFDIFKRAMTWRRRNQDITSELPEAVRELLFDRALGWEQLPHNALWIVFLQNYGVAEELSIAWQNVASESGTDNIFLISKVDKSGTIIQ